MSDLNDDALDQLLRDQFEGPVPDDGFCDRALLALPARRRSATWPLTFGIALGGLLCWLTLHATPLVRAAWHDWFSGHPTAPAIILLAAMTGLSLLALAWSMAEAYDR
ncbi:MAG TPA: hypothetical protein VMF58_14915 [Rhizomicrobium sp.]|nr:hypothetical protein [Rhizomicrobium sp.]